MALSAWMIAMPALSGAHADMPGMRMSATATTAGVIVPAAYCIGVSGLLLLGFLRGRGALAHAVMAAGMGAMFVAMA